MPNRRYEMHTWCTIPKLMFDAIDIVVSCNSIMLQIHIVHLMNQVLWQLVHLSLDRCFEHLFVLIRTLFLEQKLYNRFTPVWIYLHFNFG